MTQMKTKTLIKIINKVEWEKFCEATMTNSYLSTFHHKWMRKVDKFY